MLGNFIIFSHTKYLSAVKYSWYKFRSNNWVYPGHPYHFNSQAGYLYFSEVQFTDDRQYFCIVTLTARQGMVKSTQQPVARTSYGRYLVIKPGSKYRKEPLKSRPSDKCILFVLLHNQNKCCGYYKKVLVRD